MFDIASRGRFFCADKFVLLVHDAISPIGIEFHLSLATVEMHKPELLAVATRAFPDDFLATSKFVARGMCIGSLLVVDEAIATAAGSHAIWKIDLQSPTAQVESMHTVITQLTVTPLPEPVPVVVNAVIEIRHARCRPLPEIVIEICGNIGRFSFADGFSSVAVPASCKIDFANNPFA